MDLCQKYRVALIVDETQSALKTGKFFSCEHYEGFEPDFYVFGKGIVNCGIATHVKHKHTFNFKEFDTTTIQMEAITTLRSIQVLKKVRQSNLLDNAATMGKLLLQGLREKDKEKKSANITVMKIGIDDFHIVSDTI
jgi:acetylornithine/succinyldiaminopimelate/putrescine aminotransferase